MKHESGGDEDHRPRGHQLSDGDVALLTRIEAGEHTFRPGDATRGGQSMEELVSQLRSLRDRGLIRLADSRIMITQEGRYLGAGPCDLTAEGRMALERDRRLGPRP
jgi:hypothetical protein